MDDNEFELEQARTLATPDDEELEDAEQEEGEPDELGFVEISEDEYARLSLSEQRKYRFNLEKAKKAQKRANARNRKQDQRKREAAGVPTGIRNKVEALWAFNRTDVETNPTRADELAILLERLNDMDIMRQKVGDVYRMMDEKPTDEKTAQWLEFVYEDMIEHGKKYGVCKGWLPPFLLLTMLETRHHMQVNKVWQALLADPSNHYKAHFGWDIDDVNRDFYHTFLGHVVEWYMQHRRRPDFQYDWTDFDRMIMNELEIPERYITEPFGEDPRRPGGPPPGKRGVWARFYNFKNNLEPAPYGHGAGSTSTSEILASDAAALKSLRELGYL
ncbi:MAG TPA: hypothetical protein VK709_19050 [Candidatus Saccharimonadales bacterium]|jgi:hypothetical protein|nr:hypothetical protein [Candidatus Saccharimonadales bacterium]